MLELERVSAGYGDTIVLRDVTVRVPAGRVVALLGRNGAGKTTLLRVASGLLRPMAGAIRLDGRCLVDDLPEDFAKAGICHIPEGRAIFRTMTVRENLLLQAGATGGEEAITKAIEAFPRLGERLDQIAGTMSGGEQQMLAVARAYVAGPDYVLLDEVSLGLAPRVVDEIFDFLRRMASTGAALLLVEQYVTRALELCDFVFILNQGEVVFAGEPQELDESQVFRTYTGVTV